jgi:hypothetical protein
MQRSQKNCPTTRKRGGFLYKLKAWSSRLGIRHEPDNFVLEKVTMLKSSTKEVKTKRKGVSHEENQGQN